MLIAPVVPLSMESVPLPLELSVRPPFVPETLIVFVPVPLKVHPVAVQPLLVPNCVQPVLPVAVVLMYILPAATSTANEPTPDVRAPSGVPLTLNIDVLPTLFVKFSSATV